MMSYQQTQYPIGHFQSYHQKRPEPWKSWWISQSIQKRKQIAANGLSLKANYEIRA